MISSSKCSKSLYLIFPLNIFSKKSLSISDEIGSFSMYTISSPFLIILSNNFKNLSLSSNQLTFLNISFLIFFSLSKKVLVSLCLPYLSKPLRSYLCLVSLCKSCLSKPYLSKPSLLKELKSYFVLVYLCLPYLSKPLISYFSGSSGSSGSSVNSDFLDSSNIFNFSGYFFFKYVLHEQVHY